jgi:hypothetical protein
LRVDKWYAVPSLPFDKTRNGLQTACVPPQAALQSPEDASDKISPAGRTAGSGFLLNFLKLDTAASNRAQMHGFYKLRQLKLCKTPANFLSKSLTEFRQGWESYKQGMGFWAER